MPCAALQPTSKPGRPRHSVLQVLDGDELEEFNRPHKEPFNNPSLLLTQEPKKFSYNIATGSL
jgi:hypothetical protein